MAGTKHVKKRQSGFTGSCSSMISIGVAISGELNNSQVLVMDFSYEVKHRYLVPCFNLVSISLFAHISIF